MLLPAAGAAHADCIEVSSSGVLLPASAALGRGQMGWGCTCGTSTRLLREVKK